MASGTLLCHTLKMSPNYETDDARWQAVQARDAHADGQFFYAVASTGVFCWPSCAARPARRENVSFFPTAAAAARAGFRACKRCRPDLPPRQAREAALVEAACRTLETAETEPSLAALALAAGIGESLFQRTFKRVAGVTPKAYAAAHKARRVQETLAAGHSVTDALYAAGFGSAGRFYEAAPALLGMKPTAYRAGGAGEQIRYAVAACKLGAVLVATTAIGVCAIQLGDVAETLVTELVGRFPGAECSEAGPALADTVARVVKLVDDPAHAADPLLPLDIRGTAFQRQVWEVLATIPAGQTASYAEVARRIGKPAAVRAVASACGANALAIAIPCHRVVATSGKLAGYRWGVERKRQLLAGERL